jgi:hypothetical protein
MRINHRLIRRALGVVCVGLFLAQVMTNVTVVRVATAKDRTALELSVESALTESDSAAATYKWNIGEKELPLLGLIQEHLKVGFDQSLSYPAGQFDFPIFRSLSFDEEQGKYLLPVISKSNKSFAFIELAPTHEANTFVSAEGVELVDKNSLKIIRTADGTKYLFVQYPDGEFRCASIKQAAGGVLNLLYTANGLTLHGVVDASGRSLTFNYGKEGIHSLTQTWMSNSEGFTKTWTVGDENYDDNSTKYAHAVGVKTGKFLPSNAVVHEYTADMAASDKILAQVFGGPNAVAGANGFEPAGLAASYPLYRGDTIGDDGKVRRGHLSYAMHVYGSPDGRGDSPLYVPAGFTSHSSEPSPTDAAVTFYYPRLGNMTDVTIAVFHVSDFQIVTEGDRVRIGNIGGPGGSSPLYKHSHIEFYRGNTSLPSAAARAALRIDPATVFGK